MSDHDSPAAQADAAIPFTTASGSEVRVRFCPSPTGTPHVGLIRTALFNWAYARHTGGAFVFRIEDTDASRDSEESYEQIVDALRWLRLDWDEGIDLGGPHAPYRQSERSTIYQDVIARLLDAGHLYESYSTAEEIDARNEAAGRVKQLGYDNHDRDLTPEQVEAFRAEGRAPALRLRVPDMPLTFDDMVRGEVTFPAGSFQDFVVMRPNGVPLYTFVNPVDDALMGITHVLRGEDLLSSTPRQIALYLALIDIGLTEVVPRFGHLPYVMGEGNRKLSKRDPESNLFHHRENGFIPEGLNNYLALLGWSLAHDRDVFSMDEMVAAFDVVDVNPNPARFDLKKALSINGDHLRMLELGDFAARLVPYLQSAGVVASPMSERERSILVAAAPLVQERISVLSEGVRMMRFLFVSADRLEYDDEARSASPENAGLVIAAGLGALELVPETEWASDRIQRALTDALVDDLKLKPRVAFGPVRLAVSGARVSPPLFESIEILGKPETIARLNRFAVAISEAAR